MRSVDLSFLNWKPWTRLCRALRGAKKHVCEPYTCQSSFYWVLLFLLAPLGLYVAALGFFYMIFAELSLKRAKCPRHVAQRLVIQVASSVLWHAIKQRMQLAVQKLAWYHSVQAQEARWQQPSRMVERAPGRDDSSDEFVDALGPSEGDDDGAGATTRTTSTSRPAYTEERIFFDRLGNWVHEPAEPPPQHRPASEEEDSSEGLAPELLSSGSSVQLPPGAPPAGPPPPVPIQYTEAIATRVAQAVSNALHLTEGRALALIPPDWQQMRNVTLCMRAMTPRECFHPHTVHVSDDFRALPAEPEGPTVPGPAPVRTPCLRARMTTEEVDEAIADLELSTMIDTLEEEEATNPDLPEETEAGLASSEALEWLLLSLQRPQAPLLMLAPLPQQIQVPQAWSLAGQPLQWQEAWLKQVGPPR